MNDFGRYILGQLPAPWQYETATLVQAIVSAIGEEFAAAREVMMRCRLAKSAPTADGIALDLLGTERGLPRLNDETDDEYRVRLVGARWLYRTGGTTTGMALAVRALGFDAAEIIEGPVAPYANGTYRANGAIRASESLRWDEFAIRLPGAPAMTEAKWARLRATVAKWKAAHTRCKRVEWMMSAVDGVTAAEQLDVSQTITVGWLESVGASLRANGRALADGVAAADGEPIAPVLEVS